MVDVEKLTIAGTGEGLVVYIRPVGGHTTRIPITTTPCDRDIIRRGNLLASESNS